MQSKKQFDFAAFCELDKFVRSHFPSLSSSAFHIYHGGLPHLERIMGVGLCGSVCVPVDKWADAAGVTTKTVGIALRQLVSVRLIAFTPGNSKLRRCNVVRRSSLREIQRHLSPDILHASIPQQAEEIAARLARIPITWKGASVTPAYTVAKTGRIYMRSPNLQNTPERERFPNLALGVPAGWILTSCDYKAAEPSILFHALRQQGLLTATITPEAIYQHVATLRSIERQIAKREFLGLVYSPWKDISVPADWNAPRADILHGVLQAVNQYRHHLWQIGEPGKGASRHTTTLLGRKITACPRENMHRGKLLSWHLQGTLADIFLAGLSKVIEAHEANKLRFCLQLHDSVIAAVPVEGSNLLKAVLEGPACENGIHLHAEQRQVNQDILVKVGNLHQSPRKDTQGNLPHKGVTL